MSPERLIAERRGGRDANLDEGVLSSDVANVASSRTLVKAKAKRFKITRRHGFFERVEGCKAICFDHLGHVDVSEFRIERHCVLKTFADLFDFVIGKFPIFGSAGIPKSKVTQLAAIPQSHNTKGRSD